MWAEGIIAPWRETLWLKIAWVDEDTRAKLDDNYANLGQLNYHQAEALRRYTSIGASMNHALRGTEGYRDDQVSQEASDMDDAFAAAPALAHNMTLYRGAGRRSPARLTDTNKVPAKGDLLRDKGYLSTTIDDEFSRDFGNHQIVINAPKGTPAVWLNHSNGPISGYGDEEEEVLLPRSLPLTVDQISHNYRCPRCLDRPLLNSLDPTSQPNDKESEESESPDFECPSCAQRFPLLDLGATGRYMIHATARPDLHAAEFPEMYS